MKKKKILLIATVAATLASCGGKGGGRPSFGDNEYPVVTVGTKSAAMQTTYPATIKGVQDVQICPKVQGFITQINVKEGQTVDVRVLLQRIQHIAAGGAILALIGLFQRGEQIRELKDFPALRGDGVEDCHVHVAICQQGSCGLRVVVAELPAGKALDFDLAVGTALDLGLELFHQHTGGQAGTSIPGQTDGDIVLLVGGGLGFGRCRLAATAGGQGKDQNQCQENRYDLFHDFLLIFFQIIPNSYVPE